jgi:polyvinyl alcohol dehydrogenase (cytochrome)
VKNRLLAWSQAFGVARSAAVLVIGLLAATRCTSSNGSHAGSPDAGAMEAAAPEGGPQPAAPQPDCSADASDWPMFGQNVCNTASASGAGINTDSVKNLAVKWTYDKAAGAAGEVSATPAVVAGSVYFPDWGGMINRLDAATGKQTWSKSVGDLLAQSGNPGSLGGFVSRDTPLVTQGMVIFGTVRDPPQVILNPGAGAYLIAMDQDTGAVKWVTQLDSHRASVITGSPVLEKSTLYIGVSSQEEYSGLAARYGIAYNCCSFRGSVAAVDVATGKVLWKTHTISDALYYADAGSFDAGAGDAGSMASPGYTGIAIWSSTPVVDRKRNQLIVTTGDNYSLPSGAPGIVDGNWVDAVVALDLTTGNLNWVQPLPGGGMATSDAFAIGISSGPDSDFGAGANLFTAMIDGAPKDLVGAGQKSGVYFALDAQTGKIVWQTKIGPGGGLGGIHWGTATDGIRVYAGVNNGSGTAFALAGNGPMTTSGAWAALDVASGAFVWEREDPVLMSPLSGASVNGPVVVVNGVMFGGSMDMDGTMFALDAATGAELWRFQSGGTVYGGPAVSNGVVYWGTGYPGYGGASAKRPLGFGTMSTKGSLFAFAAP